MEFFGRYIGLTPHSRLVWTMTKVAKVVWLAHAHEPWRPRTV